MNILRPGLLFTALTVTASLATACAAPSDERDVGVTDDALTARHQGTIAFDETRTLEIDPGVPGAFSFYATAGDAVTVRVAAPFFAAKIVAPSKQVVALLSADADDQAEVRLSESGRFDIVVMGDPGRYPVSLSGGSRGRAAKSPFDATCDDAPLTLADVAALRDPDQGDTMPWGEYRLYRTEQVCDDEFGQRCESDRKVTFSTGNVRLYTWYGSFASPSYGVRFALDDHGTACLGRRGPDGTTGFIDDFGAACTQPNAAPREATCDTYKMAETTSLTECRSRYLWAAHGDQASLSGTITKSCMKLSAIDRHGVWNGSLRKWTITKVAVLGGTALTREMLDWTPSR